MTHRAYIERLLITILVVGLALLLWELKGILILVFASVLVAVVLRSIANPIRRWCSMPEGLALLIAVLIVAAILAVAFWMFGSRAIAQASELQRGIPQAWLMVESRLDTWGMGGSIQSAAADFGARISSNLASILMTIGNVIADILLVIAGGIFLAVEPDLYRRGLIKLVPKDSRPNLEQTLEDTWNALRLWLAGRLLSMLIIGILTGIGLWLIGIPAVLALAVLAALLEFVPFIGPIMAAIPAVLLALAINPTLALWTAGLYLVIQTFEGNILEPLIQRHAVSLPPTLLLFAVIAFGFLFGFVGILLAAPLLVVIYVWVKRLYVRDALDTRTEVPGSAEDG